MIVLSYLFNAYIHTFLHLIISKILQLYTALTLQWVPWWYINDAILKAFNLAWLVVIKEVQEIQAAALQPLLDSAKADQERPIMYNGNKLFPLSKVQFPTVWVCTLPIKHHRPTTVGMLYLLQMNAEWHADSHWVIKYDRRNPTRLKL